MSIIDKSLKDRETGFDDDDIDQKWLLMRGMNDLRLEHQLVDVTLIVEGQHLKPCHRSVLAACSPYFRAMFTHDLAEQYQNEIEIKDLDFNSVSAIVDYLYTAKIDINDENVQDLLTACSILQIAGLYGKSYRYMQKRLTVQNAAEVYSFAKRLCCTELQNDAFAFLTKRFIDIAKTDGFLELCKDDFVDVISADQLAVEKETVVYESVLSWLMYDIASRAKIVSEVFSHVRFVLLDDDYLENCIAHEPLLMELPHLCSQVKTAQFYKLLKSKVNSMSSHEKLNECTEYGENLEEEKDGSPDQDKNGVSDPDELANPKKTADEILLDLNFADTLYDIEVVGNVKAPNLQTYFHAKAYIDCPYYEIYLNENTVPIKLPLEILPRSGMLKSDVLLFSNGRKTVIMDPFIRHYFCGVQGNETMKNENNAQDEDNVPGVDQNMPIMKNAEIYAAKNGTVYLIGGLEVDRSSQPTLLRSRVFTFDAENLKWISRRSLQDPRCMMGMGEIEGSFVLTGGKALSNGNILSTVEIYNPDKDIWWKSTSMPKALYGHQCASTRDRLFVIGGKTGEGEIERSVYFLSAITHQWTESVSMNAPRFLAGATVLRSPSPSKKAPDREVIYVVGGVGKEGLLSSIELFNPSTMSRWKFGEEFPGNRCAQTITSLDGKICAVGGHVTERSGEGGFESIQKFDIFTLEAKTNDAITSDARHWQRIVRYIRGIFGTSCACTGTRIDRNKLNYFSS